MITKVVVKEFPRSVKLIINDEVIFKEKKTKDNLASVLTRIKSMAFDYLILRKLTSVHAKFEIEYLPIRAKHEFYEYHKINKWKETNWKEIDESF